MGSPNTVPSIVQLDVWTGALQESAIVQFIRTDIERVGKHPSLYNLESVMPG